MLGGFLALLAAATFAWTNAAVRRGVVTGSVAQATILSIPLGVPVFLAALLATGNPSALGELTPKAIAVFAAVGILHFIMGRYCNYRSLKAIGANLAGPLLQMNVLVTLALAILLLGERLSPLRILGILLVVAGPALTHERGAAAPPAADADPAAFRPKYAEGYLFAALAAVCYGASPALVSYGLANKGLTVSLAGGVVAATAATLVMLVSLLWPGRIAEVRQVRPDAVKWLAGAGVLVYISQVLAYMALALAPVSVVGPIIGLVLIFRLHFSRLINPAHEVFGSQIIVGTLVSFLGVVVLSASTDEALAFLALPDDWARFLLGRTP